MTLDNLMKTRHVTGVKQVTKAVHKGTAKCVFLASDADQSVTALLKEACEAKKIEVVNDVTMRELGKACSIEVGASAAAVLM